MNFKFFVAALAAILIYGCGTTQNKKEINDNLNEMDKVTITETHWILETLDGQKIDAPQGREEIGFSLNSSENSVSGYTGCNGFFGSYSIDAGNRIKFSAMGATKMACPDSAFNESDFLEIFSLADNYSIIGDKLELYFDRRAPLAVFKAVYSN